MRKSTGKIFQAFLAVAFVAQSISCINERSNNCDLDVTFEYRYNMLSTDALSDQADLLMLYIFDERGILTATQSSGGMPLGSDYHMTLNDLPAGNYHFVAWARSNRSNTEDGGFDVPNPAIGSLSLRDMNYYLKRSGGIQQRELENLLVGVTEVKVDGGRHTQNVMVSLKKVNKKFRIVLLPYTNETTLDINDYDISITDQTGNGCIRYDYSLLPDEAITYRPYYADNVQSTTPIVSGKEETNHACVAELNTFRLMESNAIRMRIAMKGVDQDILNIDLMQFLSLTEMESHKNWSAQEYLDRQDEYVIGLFIQNGTWMQTTVMINGWEVNYLDLNI